MSGSTVRCLYCGQHNPITRHSCGKCGRTLKVSIALPPLRRRDDALEATAYGPTSSVSELTLMTGYGSPAVPVVIDRLVEAQSCVCGGVIDPERASEIPAAVAEHNATSRHLAWRERQGIR